MTLPGLTQLLPPVYSKRHRKASATLQPYLRGQEARRPLSVVRHGPDLFQRLLTPRDSRIRHRTRTCGSTLTLRAPRSAQSWGRITTTLGNHSVPSTKKLVPAKKRYSTNDRELLAAYLDVRNFIHRIEGRRTTLRTDHKPLTHMFTLQADKIGDRQGRHISFLSQHIHDIEHIHGADNIVPGGRSRIKIAANELPTLQQWSDD